MKIEIAPRETQIAADWYHANLYCQFLEVDGKNDWRLPTVEELRDHYILLEDIPGSFYWTSESMGSLAGLAIYTHHGFPQPVAPTEKLHVRAVRDI